nr:amino acid adenylation-like protein [uncultured bacterium]
MRLHCPEVLTLELPGEPESFAAFLDHVWAFDRARVTQEDRSRTRMYQEASERRRFRSQALSLKEFIDGLGLRVEIAAAAEGEFARISQLTLRTNQFNFTARRRSEPEVREFLQRPGAHCMTVRVADRFGDYGLVGVLMYEGDSDRYRVDTLLLSCRVLGRGVEHALVAWLGTRALADGKAVVELSYEPSQKNRPALEFLQEIAGDSLSVPAKRLAAVKYDPDEKQSEPAVKTAAAPAAKPGYRSELLQRIADELRDTARLAQAIEAHSLGKQVAQGPATLATLWARVLGRPEVGPDENFFEAGGTSLKAVQLVALIRKELNQWVSVVSVFECPTLAFLSAKVGTPPERPSAVPAALLRGQRRRQNAARMKGS